MKLHTGFIPVEPEFPTFVHSEVHGGAVVVEPSERMPFRYRLGIPLLVSGIILALCTTLTIVAAVNWSDRAPVFLSVCIPVSVLVAAGAGTLTYQTKINYYREERDKGPLLRIENIGDAKVIHLPRHGSSFSRDAIARTVSVDMGFRCPPHDNVQPVNICGILIGSGDSVSFVMISSHVKGLIQSRLSSVRVTLFVLRGSLREIPHWHVQPPSIKAGRWSTQKFNDWLNEYIVAEYVSQT